MLRYLFVFMIILHALIHLMGFTKAYSYASVSQLTQHISKFNGTLWLISAVLFIAGGVMFIFKKEWWWLILLATVFISQYLILTSWQDAKFGIIANAIILLVAIVGGANWNFNNKFISKVNHNLQQTATIAEDVLTETDMQHLPENVKKYLRYTGAVGKSKVKNFKVEFSGEIRKNEQSEWMPFTSVQYNFLDAASRRFFMKATMKGLPVAGFHNFENGKAFMDIRLLSLFRVQYQEGAEMNIAETVTFFNDMCCMAPATLIDKRIQWLETDENRVNASFTLNDITITAWLHFNEKGELVNFISDDRYAMLDDGSMKQFRWSTPTKDYRDYNGIRLAGGADAVYGYPDGDFVYGTFRLTGVQFNCREF